MGSAYETIRHYLTSDSPLPLTWDEARALADQTSPAERGRLMPIIWITRADEQGAGPIHGAFAQFIRHADPEPSFDAVAAEEGIAALLALMNGPVPTVPQHSVLSPEKMFSGRLSGDLFLVLTHLTEGLPEEAKADLADLIPILTKTPIPAITVAKLADDREAEAAAVEMLLGNLDSELLAREWGLFLKADPQAFLRGMLVFNHLPTHHSESETRHERVMDFLNSVPGYGEFAQNVMSEAVEQFDLISRGEIPYKADGAFSLDDCSVIERAVLFGLAHAETWCLDQIAPLWRTAIVAPDAKAKTMPSQSMSIRLANASISEPRPEALRALNEAASLCRHAGVKKKLDRAKRAARTALAAHPERLIDLPPDEEIPKDLARPFAEAVESLLSRTGPYAAPDWLSRFGPERKAAWKLACNLIWDISSDDGTPGFLALPVKRGKDLVWQSLTSEHPFEQHAQIRLWHPVDSGPEEARHWRSFLEQQGIQQPFLQAGREIYRPAPSEMSGTSIGAFAGSDVTAVSLVGLSRVSGWYSGYQDELHLIIAGHHFVLSAGVRVYHGSGDYGTTGNLWLSGPEARLDQVPPRIISEAMRKTDLLVTVGERHRKK